MDSLINFDGLSDVANNIIDKIASATNWFVSRETPKKIAANTYIEEIKNSSYDPLTKAALISNTNKTIKEYCNQCDIVQKSISLLTKDANVKDVSDDWIAEFMDKARLISDDEYQMIWAKILAGEMKTPGSYSLRTLETLKNLSKQEAELFQRIASFVVWDKNRYVVFSDDELLNKYGINFEDFLQLSECGLFSSNRLSLHLFVNKEQKEDTIRNKSVIGILHYAENKKNTLWVYVYVLSEAGRQLMNAINIEPNSKFFIDALSKIVEINEDVELTAHNIIETFDDGRISYEEDDILGSIKI